MIRRSYGCVLPALVIVLLGRSVQAEPATGTQTATAAERGAYRATVSIGFSHWYGQTFGAPPGVYTPGVTVGWIPLRLIEVQVAYSFSAVKLDLPTDEYVQEESRVGFLTAALLLRRSLRVAGEHMTFACGIVGGLVHTKDGAGPAVGGAIVARYLIDLPGGYAVGPFADVRAILYALPGTSKPLYKVEDGRLVTGHSDAHIQIGVAVGF